MAERPARSSTVLGNRSRVAPYPAPSLQHRTSQTVIDLTEDSDDDASAQRSRRATSNQARSGSPRRSHSRVGILSLPRLERPRPPRFGRHNILDSEGEDEEEEDYDEGEDVDNHVDLTAEIIAGNNRHDQGNSSLFAALRRNIYGPEDLYPRRRSQFDMRRPAGLPAPSPNLVQAPRASLNLGALPNYAPHGPNQNQARGSFGSLSDRLQRVISNMPSVAGHPLVNLIGRAVGNQAGINNMAMNYEVVAFAHHHGEMGRRAPAEKAPYVPPPPARPGFTRSLANLKEDEILVCAACDEELVVKPKEDPPAKTTAKGKPLTEKERAEHDFWAIRKCGHVFCNACYQNRKDKSEGGSYFYAPGRPKTEKTLICTVDDCHSNVAKPTDWIGMFL